MKKLDLRSMDIVKEQREKLRQLFPEVFTEDKIDFDKLRLTLGEMIETGKERYGMTWPGKADCFKIIQSPSIGTLKPSSEESVNFDTTENLFIEGDNLEVLKLLQKSYYGKIKMIYIDPPYNTGKEFIYPDDYKENLKTYLQYTGQIDAEGKKFSTNTDREGRFHSKWLNMMYPRLFLARNLLRDDGVIFISIDDNEVDNLKKICNEIFGEENFVSTICWHNNVKGRQMDLHIKNTYENILIYSKSGNVLLNTEKDKIDTEKMEKDDISYFKKDYPLHNGTADFHINNRPNLCYSIYYNPSSKDVVVIDEKYKKNGSFFIDKISDEGKKLIDSGYVRIIPKFNSTYNNQRVWRWGREKFLNEYKTELLFVKEDGGYYIYQKKRFKNGIHEKKMKNYINIDSGKDKTYLVDLFDNNKVFESPKPTSLIIKLIQISTNANDLILDFFAGSGTTGDAVMRLNKEDGGNRKFIMVQLPEKTDEKSEAYKAGYKTIADIGKERIRRVIKKIQEEQKKDNQKNLFDKSNDKKPLDLGFKVFKLDKSNFKIWDGENIPKDKKSLEKQLKLYIDHIDPKATQEDILFEILLKAGFELTTKIEKIELAGKAVYSIEDGAMLVCLEKELTKEVIKAMAERKPSRVICLDRGFLNNDQLKTNAVQIMKSKGVDDFRTV